MKARMLIPALLLACGAAFAKTADDFVHGGAAKYIQGRMQEASIEVEEGLRAFPGDARLKALSDQLKAMKDQQKQDQGGGEGRGGEGSDQKKDQRDSSAQGEDQNRQQYQGGREKDKQEQQKQDDGKDGSKDGKQDQRDSAGQGADQPPQPEPGREGDSSGQGGAAPVPPGQMSEEEAERLLNSYQDDEKREQKNLMQRYKKPVQVEEDW